MGLDSARLGAIRPVRCLLELDDSSGYVFVSIAQFGKPPNVAFPVNQT